MNQHYQKAGNGEGCSNIGRRREVLNWVSFTNYLMMFFSLGVGDLSRLVEVVMAKVTKHA